MKKHVVIFISLLIIAAVATVSVVAAVSSNKDKPDSDVNQETGLYEVVDGLTASTQNQDYEECLSTEVSEESVPITEDGSFSHAVLGKTYRLEFSGTEPDPIGPDWEIYTDEEGNMFKYDENGNFLGVTFDPRSFDNSVSMEHKEDPSHPFTDEDAIAAAEELGREQFGDYFDRLNYHFVLKADTGERYVFFYQLIGEEQFVTGIHFHATYLGDGTLLGFAMPNCYSLMDFDESLLQGVTKDSVTAYLDSKTKELHGDRLIDWNLSGDKVSLQRDEDGFFLEASVMAHVHFDSGDWDDGGHTYRIRLPFEG